jgi:hypothetical protein
MSHSVNIITQFKNLKNLLNQFVKAGWTIKQNDVCRTFASDPRKNEVHAYVAVNPEERGYDVGINLDKSGNAYFVCDFFGGSIERSLGAGMHKVKQGYALDEIKEFMHSEDLEYDVNQLATGELVVTARG